MSCQRKVISPVSIYLEDTELADSHNQSKSFSDEYRKPFGEFERISANKPPTNLPDIYPLITDGTLSSLMAEKPMRIWAQLQSGRFKPTPGTLQDFPEYKKEMLNIFWANKVVKYANSDAPFFAKLQVAEHKASIYGTQPVLLFNVNKPHYTGADFMLVSPRTTHFEPGKSSAWGSDYIWHDQHYTKLQVKRIIRILERSEDKSGWDLQALKEIYNSDAFTSPDEDSLTEEEKRASEHRSVITLSTCYHRGYGAPFITIVPKNGNSSSLEVMKIVRRRKNDDRSGGIPIKFMYNRYDLSNPFGVSEVALAGPTQNTLDFHTAAHALATQQGLEPSLKIKGDPDTTGMDLDSLIWSPGQHMYVGDGDFDVVNPNTSTYSQFPNTMSMYKTQVMNLHGTSDMSSSSASSGDSTFSKTQAGVKFQAERGNTRDNFSRQRCDEFLSELAVGLMQMTLSKVHGTEVVEITESQRDKLTAAGHEVPEGVDSITIEFEELRDAVLDYEVDANSSKLSDDAEAREIIIETIKVLFEVPELDTIMAEDGKKLNMGELIKRLLTTSGIEGVEKIITDMSPEEIAAMQATTQPPMPPEGGEMMQQQLPQELPPEQPPMEQALPQPAPQPQTPPEEIEALRAELMARGWDEQRIEIALRMIEQAGGQ